MGSIDWKGIIIAGWPVLSVLFVGSIISIGVMIEKWKTFSKIHTKSDSFLESIKKSDIQKVILWCEKSDQPLATITNKVLRAPMVREDKERILDRAIQSEAHDLESRMSILGTVASVAPFVGLLGTVIGIIKSFHAVSMSSTAGASAVSIGIAEALVGTAAGLVVAIPAVLSYNYFVNRLRRLIQEWELVGGEIIDWALSGGRS